MQLYTYHHRVVTVPIDRQWLSWVTEYMRRAVQKAQGDPRFFKRMRGLKAHKLCSIAYAQYFGLMDQWQANHEPVSIWPPREDFVQNGLKIKLVAVSANEQSGDFGPHLVGRVWGNDYKRHHDRYVLSCWYPPFVDLIGWVDHETLANYQRVSNFGTESYDLQEIVTRPMAQILEPV